MTIRQKTCHGLGAMPAIGGEVLALTGANNSVTSNFAARSGLGSGVMRKDSAK
jgi:hypothetical protein